MTTSAGELFVRVRPDADKFGRELNDEVEKAGRSAGQLLTDAISVGAVVGGFAKITSAASDLEQAIGGTEAVFGEASDTIDAFAEGADEAAGLSKAAARTLTTQIGSLLQGFEFTQEEAAATSVQLAQLGADLSAITGAGSAEEAIQALGAALRGEYDPLERFSVSINTTQANLKAVELGLADTTSAVDQNARAQATLALVYERAGFAAEGFANEADTAAGAAAIASAKADNAAADLGENFLPIYTEVAEITGQVAEAFGNLPDGLQTALIVLGGAAAVAGPVARTYRDISSAVQDTKEKFQDANSPTRRYASTLGKIGGAAAGVFAAVQALDALGDAVNSGRFGSATDDTERLGDAFAKLAEGELTGALAEDITGLAGAFKALGQGNTANNVDDLFGVFDNVPVVGRAINGVEGELTDFVFGTEEAAGKIDDLDKALAELIRENPEAGRAAFENLKVELQALGIDTEQVNDKFDDTAGVLADIESGAIGAADGLAETEGAVAGLDTDFKDLGNAIGEAKKQFDELDEAVFGQRDAELGLEDARLGEQEAALDLRDAQTELNEAIREHGPNSREAQDASLRLQRAQIDLERAQIDVLDAQRDLNQASIDQADILENQTVPGMVAYLEMLQQIRDTAPETAGGIAAVNEQLRDLTEALGRQAAGSVGDLLSGVGGFIQQGAFAEAFATGNRGDLYRVNGRAGG